MGGVRCVRHLLRDLLRVEIGRKDCIGILRIAVQHQRQRLDRRRKIGAALPIRPELGHERCLGARENKRTYVSVLGELSAKEAHTLKRLYPEWLFWDEHEVPEYRRNKEHRYSSGISIENDESAVLFYRLGLILPVHITVEEYRRQSPVTQNNWSRDDPPYYVEGGDQTLVLGDLSVVGLTGFGEKFCNAVIGDVSGLCEPPDWAKELKPSEKKKKRRGAVA